MMNPEGRSTSATKICHPLSVVAVAYFLLITLAAFTPARIGPPELLQVKAFAWRTAAFVALHGCLFITQLIFQLWCSGYVYGRLIRVQHTWCQTIIIVLMGIGLALWISGLLTLSISLSLSERWRLGLIFLLGTGFTTMLVNYTGFKVHMILRRAVETSETR